MADDLEFKISTGLKDIIGKDLITDDFIAVFELVKNTFDARAKNVIIRIEEDKIVIADNGKGMSLDDIKNKWLFVAYSAKKDGTEDIDKNSINNYRDKIQERRFYAGAKGIGRFSSDRLGRYLVLKTKTKESDQVEEIHIDWPLFEINQNELFEEVKVQYQQQETQNISFPNNALHGTILEITKLYSNWNREQLKRLKHSLEKLINPFSERNDFSIEIVCPKEIDEDNKKDENGNFVHIERDRINGEVKNSILEILNIKTTQIEVKINKVEIKTKIIDRGTLIYEIKEDNREYSLLEDMKIDLYFLNRAAKYNFTSKMGVEPVNFGSVFLFKNGFRVQPFGETEDDSWGLDYRAQQGYNRFLGTRDLFGRVEIISENVKQFREVSSRDGGLVETVGYHQLMKAFKDKGLVRLERYVVGVLWGEGFRRRKYFGEGEEANIKADTYRKELQKLDKESEDVSHAISNLGSKLDFIQIIKGLTLNKKIEIINFNRDFINLVNERLDEVDSRFILELETVAESIHDQETKDKLFAAGRKYQELIKEKEAAQQRALLEEQRRIEAEKRAEEEEKKRIEAEKRQKEEEEKRRKAELETLQKEKERAEAEVARLRAEQKAKEEEEGRKKSEISLKQEKDKNTYLSATRKTLSDDAEELIHSIKVSVIGIDESLEKILEKVGKDSKINQELYIELSNIKLISERVKKLSMLITKSNFKADQEVQKVDVVQFIKEYIDTYSFAYKGKIDIYCKGQAKFISRLSILDLSIVIDNLISNSQKAGAKKIEIEFQKHDKELFVLFHDNGDGLDLDIFPEPEVVFNLGVKSEIEGSGIGLYSIKKKMKEMYGDIEFLGNKISLKGATFKLIFK